MLPKALLLSCLASTLFMTGLIWFVQVVHYPLFSRVEERAFGAYHLAHTRLTTVVVLAPMLVELLTSVGLVACRPASVGLGLAWSGLVAAALTWASTVFVQVPLHERLSSGFDPAVHRSLVATNLARAIVWTVHAVLVLAMVAQSLKG